MKGGMDLNKNFMNFILLAISFASSLFAAELYLRWNPPVAVYMATRNIVQQTHSEPSSDPRISYIPRAGLIKPFRNREFNTTVKINSMNMRDREYSLEKPVGVKRIAAMGDSFVFGWGVENPEVFTEILETKLLKNTEVLNFGVSGYAAYQELERLKKEALRFHPDVVLFFLYGIPEEYTGVDPVEEQSPPRSLKKDIVRFFEKYSYLFVLFQESRGVLQVSKVSRDPAKQLSEIEKGWDVLKSLKKMSEDSHFVPIVIYIPVKQYAFQGKDSDAQRVLDYCLNENLPFLDLTAPLHDAWLRDEVPYFRIDDHWNRVGHRTVAQSIKSFLEEKQLAS